MIDLDKLSEVIEAAHAEAAEAMRAKCEEIARDFAAHAHRLARHNQAVHIAAAIAALKGKP